MTEQFQSISTATVPAIIPLILCTLFSAYSLYRSLIFTLLLIRGHVAQGRAVGSIQWEGKAGSSYSITVAYEDLSGVSRRFNSSVPTKSPIDGKTFEIAYLSTFLGTISEILSELPALLKKHLGYFFFSAFVALLIYLLAFKNS